MGIIQDIGKGIVCLDTSVFIYYIEEDERYIKIVSTIFDAINEGVFLAITSGITLLEALVVPLRLKDKKLANEYELFLTKSEGLALVPLDHELLLKATYLRANFQIKTPDALQIAAAQNNDCHVFVTNDRRIPQVPGMRVLQLSDYLQ